MHSVRRAWLAPSKSNSFRTLLVPISSPLVLASFLSRPRSFAFVFLTHSTDPPGCTNPSFPFLHLSGCPLFLGSSFLSVHPCLSPLFLSHCAPRSPKTSFVHCSPSILSSLSLSLSFSVSTRARGLSSRPSFSRSFQLLVPPAAVACLTAPGRCSFHGGKGARASSVLVGRFDPGQISRIPQGGDVESTDRSACTF